MKNLIISLFLITSQSVFGSEAFYAVSSLCSYIDDPESPSDDELEPLWEKGMSSPLVKDLVEKAHIQYRDHSSNAERCLEQAWDILQREYFLMSTSEKQFYPNFDDNPFLKKRMKILMRPHLIPLDHPYKPILDQICSQVRVTQNEDFFSKSGFVTVFLPHASFIRVARHPAVPGYLFKVYLDSELRLKDERAGWKWLVDRCKGADNIRKLIKKEKIKHFVVPDKYLYPLPVEPSPVLLAGQERQTVFLMVTDMELADLSEAVDAWKNKITKEHLRELYLILSHGYASAYLLANIPYTKSGKFACIDTEYVKRKIDYKMLRPFLSEEMLAYWDELVKTANYRLP